MYELCRHVKSNGCRCHSPAQRFSACCCFHVRVRKAQEYISIMDNLDLPVFEDRATIQLAITHFPDPQKGRPYRLTGGR